MTDTTLLGPWVRRFLLEYLVRERNLAINTRARCGCTWCTCKSWFRAHPQHESAV